MADGLLDRRQALKHLGIVGVSAVAGCGGVTGGPRPTESDDRTASTPVEMGSPTPTAPLDRRLTELTTSELTDAPVSITAAIRSDSITPTRTARFTLTVEAVDATPVEIHFGNAIPFSAPQQSDPEGIYLLVSGHEYGRRNNRTWLPDPDTGESIYPPDKGIIRQLKPGEAISDSWEVWADPDHASFIEAGTYEFSNTLHVASSDETIRWSLSLAIEADTRSR